jgi:hypothetical protein
MKYLIASLILICGFQVWAQTVAPAIKSWKTFRSDFGYEFKYPDCWKTGINDPDENGSTETVKDVLVEETSVCSRPRLDPEIPNGLGFRAGWDPPKTKEAARKEIEFREKNSSNDIARKEDFLFKKLKLGSDDAIAWVEFLPNGDYKDIRWKLTIYCSNWWVSVGGPTIRNPDKSYFDKFKVGDLALPEPEKTILESIRCVPPKQKETQKNTGNSVSEKGKTK